MAGQETHNGEPLYGILAEFKTAGALKKAAAMVRDAGYRKWDCYSPFPVHGIDQAMGIKRTILPVIVFCGGLTGCALGLLLQWWTNAFDWAWLTSGKPFFSLPANIPITFETTVLLSAFATFFGMWGLDKLPQVWHPFFRNERFDNVTDNSFFIGLEAADPRFDKSSAEDLFERAGSIAVEPCYLDVSPKNTKLPSAVVTFIVLTTLLAAIPFAIAARKRATKSEKPHYHLIPDMDFQYKNKPQSTSGTFKDGRAMRSAPEGTVAVNDLQEDDHFYRGIVEDTTAPAKEWLPGEPRPTKKYLWATTFPEQVDLSTAIERGQDMFNIYCAPCHGTTGDGNGPVHQRAMEVPNRWTPPVSIHDERFVRMPHGQLYGVIANGVRTMPSYAAQISVEDRWAVVLYMRALQRSQKTTVDEVPADKRDGIEPPPAAPGADKAADDKAADDGAAPDGAAPAPAPAGGAAPAPAPAGGAAPAPAPAGGAAPAPAPAGGAAPAPAGGAAPAPAPAGGAAPAPAPAGGAAPAPPTQPTP